LIRLESRLSQSNDLNHDQVYPIFIPSASGLVWALIDDAHDRVGHMQVSGTMEAVRDQFFIPRLKSATEKVIRLCRTCRVLRGKLMKTPFAPLPKFRCSRPDKPYTYVGI